MIVAGEPWYPTVQISHSTPLRPLLKMAEITALPTVNNDKDGRRLDDEIVEDKDKIYDTQHVEMGADDDGIDAVKAEMHTEDANRAEVFEHEMGTWQAFKIYRAVSCYCPDAGICHAHQLMRSGCLLVCSGFDVDHHGRL